MDNFDSPRGTMIHIFSPENEMDNFDATTGTMIYIFSEKMIYQSITNRGVLTCPTQPKFNNVSMYFLGDSFRGTQEFHQELHVIQDLILFLAHLLERSYKTLDQPFPGIKDAGL